MLSRASRLLGGLVDKLAKRELVGVDRAGNKYFRQEPQEGEQKEKRWVAFSGAPDPAIVPAEWTSWLSHVRKTPPSTHEMEEIARHRAMVKERAAVLEKEEEKRRYRAKSLQAPFFTENLPSDAMAGMWKERDISPFGEKVDGHGRSFTTESRCPTSSSPMGTAQELNSRGISSSAYASADVNADRPDQPKVMN
eukprot:TRINITY_DN1656_c0_g1_i4.p1 TRINITY_DN1656_c0_g1~~TRINITY_DN1656_c0_g1_i4.p1  ORF type:complete len:194 (-),score=51.73 TRINITY_DN1656_c0_g1_i4:153-734(-)